VKHFLLLPLICCFTSCEVYHRYFIMASNRYGTVKVKALYNLSKGVIPNTNMEQKNNFDTQLAISINSTRLQYSFNLPPCKTAWLQPSAFGKPVIEYIIIDDRDRIEVPDNSSNNKGIYSFKKYSRQKFLLLIK
jgi:hypothetical protein